MFISINNLFNLTLMINNNNSSIDRKVKNDQIILTARLIYEKIDVKSTAAHISIKKVSQ